MCCSSRLVAIASRGMLTRTRETVSLMTAMRLLLIQELFDHPEFVYEPKIG